MSARILAGGATYSAYLLYVSPWQINAILSSNAPAGGAQLTVTYGSLTSQPAPIQIVSTAPGIFFQPPNTAIAQNVASPTNYPLKQASTPATPGQIVILWATAWAQSRLRIMLRAGRPT